MQATLFVSALFAVLATGCGSSSSAPESDLSSGQVGRNGPLSCSIQTNNGRYLTAVGGGGRVTELTARPLLNLFYPELSGVVQPLSGEYGGRRKALEQVTFYSGYGVETGLLIDIFEKFHLESIAQVDLLERIHHNQHLEALSKMSFAIIQTVIRKLEKRFGRAVLEDVNRSMKMIRHDNKGYFLDVEQIAEYERPPMIEVPEYLNRNS